MGRNRKGNNFKRARGKRVEYRMPKTPKKPKLTILSEEEKEEILNKRFIGTYEKGKNFGFVVPDFKK